MSETRQRQEELFEAALRLAPAERRAFLNQACAGDAELRHRVEALLGAFDRAGGFMNQPVVAGSGSASHFARPPVEKPGDRIGHYKLLEQIGEGGCGVVYVAEQEAPVRRRVALKVIKLGMDTKQVIVRFDAERQALALMDHLNIAKIHDAGATDTGRPYFVMELVRGIKITDYCDQHQLPPRERLDLFIQVCRAIQHAHQKGVIHRDIKPSNILVTVNDGVPVPKVIDFGIAKATQGRLTDQTVYTAFEQFIGTPAYMSPEQAVMTSLDIDTRSDIYSLGVLLYELLTGTTPFDAKELLAQGLDEMRRTIREVEPVKPSTRLTQEFSRAKGGEGAKGGNDAVSRSTLNHQLSTDLDWIVMKCLEKDRTRRYETANGLAADITRHLNNEPIVARPPSQLYSLQKMARRHRATLIATGFFVMALVLAVVVLTFSNVRIRHEQSQKETALEMAKKNEVEAKEQLFASLKSQAEARRYSHRVGQRLESLAALTKAADIKRDEELRDAAIATLAVPDLRFGPAWHVYDTNVDAVAFDRNYERYARIDNRAVISICTVADNREIQRFASGPALQRYDHDRSLVFAPDGQLLAKYDIENRWSVWQVANAQLVLRTPAVSSVAFAFSGDSKQIAVPIDESIYIFDLHSGKERTSLRCEQVPRALAFSPDDRKLAAGPIDSDVISIFDVETGGLSSTLRVRKGGDRALAWHPSGKYLAVSANQQIQLWDVKAATLVSTMEGHAQAVTTVSFDPSGNWLIADSWEAEPRLWQPSPAREAIRFFSSLNNLKFSRDGRRAGVVYGSDGMAQQLEFLPSKVFQVFLSGFQDSQYSFNGGSISADGRLLALASTRVSLRELPSGRELAHLPIGAHMTLFHPNGKELLISGPHRWLESWSVTRDSAASSRIRLRPARRIPLPFVPYEFALAQDGRTLAVTGQLAGEARLLDLVTGTLRDTRFSHTDADKVAISPNAEWLATSGWHSAQAQLWNAKTGEPVLNLTGERTRVTVTPDGRELVVASSTAYTFYDVNTQRITRRFQRQANMHEGWIAYAKDGKLMAMEVAPGVIRLCEFSSGRTIAHLQNPQGSVSRWMSFTPDGTQLIVAAVYERAIHRWDLRAMRVELKAMRLDWDWPEFSPSVETSVPPLEIEVLESN